MMKEYTVSLNGGWLCDYIGPDAYRDEREPGFTKKPHNQPTDELPIPVPAYWEDLMDEFRKTPLHTRLAYNPLYTLQRYPQTGYVPDMALPNPVGSFVYKRTVFIEEGLADFPARLYCGGVQNTLSAWLNGTYLGRHEGYSSEFFIEIPAHALRAGENSLTLAVSNTRLVGYRGNPISGLTTRAACECTGGIYGDLSLEFMPDGLLDAYVRTGAELSTFTVYTEGAEAVDRTVTVFDGDRVLQMAVIPAGKGEVTLPRGKMALWSPDTPRLYTLRVETARQSCTRRFGIRRLTAEGTGLYMNGAPFYFRGTCEHCYHPLTVHPTRDRTYYRRVIRTLKSLGFNSIRFHTYIPMQEYMDAADELGMVLELETPNNTTLDEWGDILRMARRHASALAISSGNEMLIDEEYIEHLRAAAALVHTGSDMLFSPMSAMRGIEYFSFGNDRCNEPFPHNPVRLAALSEFCDLYNNYALGDTSYFSATGDAAELDRRQSVYKKPLLSHEICIQGTYADLSLRERYRGTRIGDTELYSSVERHLADRGLLDRAPLYYRASSAWQAMLRKECFELCRRTDTIAGYDFLGDIDTHWHTFGYCVGMMNEFYELKPGETEENVRRYNSNTVLLCDLPKVRSLTAGERLELPILVSHYGAPLKNARLSVRADDGHRVLLRRAVTVGEIRPGRTAELYRLGLRAPQTDAPVTLTLTVTLSGGDTDAENIFELYVFPKPHALPSAAALRRARLTVSGGMDADELMVRMARGESVLLLGAKPFPTDPISFQLSVAGRTNGHLATVIADHPILDGMPHKGFCDRRFATMMTGASAAVLDVPSLPFSPIVEIATTYKNARREALVFEYRIGKGRLLCSTLNRTAEDPAAVFLTERLYAYAMSEQFEPRVSITLAELSALLGAASPEATAVNENFAMNKNDITAK